VQGLLPTDLGFLLASFLLSNLGPRQIHGATPSNPSKSYNASRKHKFLISKATIKSMDRYCAHSFTNSGLYIHPLTNLSLCPSDARENNRLSGKVSMCPISFYFIQDDGGMFKPHFCIASKDHYSLSSFDALMPGVWDRNRHWRVVGDQYKGDKEDLKLPNHFTGHDRLDLRLCFYICDLLAVRCNIIPLDGAKRDAFDAHTGVDNINRDILRASSTTKISFRERDFGNPIIYAHGYTILVSQWWDSRRTWVCGEPSQKASSTR